MPTHSLPHCNTLGEDSNQWIKSFSHEERYIIGLVRCDSNNLRQDAGLMTPDLYRDEGRTCLMDRGMNI